MCMLSLFSHVRLCLCVTLWTVPCQAPLSTHPPGKEYWSGLPFPPPGDLLDQGVEPMLPVSPVLPDVENGSAHRRGRGSGTSGEGVPVYARSTSCIAQGAQPGALWAPRGMGQGCETAGGGRLKWEECMYTYS